MKILHENLHENFIDWRGSKSEIYFKTSRTFLVWHFTFLIRASNVVKTWCLILQAVQKMPRFSNKNSVCKILKYKHHGSHLRTYPHTRTLEPPCLWSFSLPVSACHAGFWEDSPGHLLDALIRSVMSKVFCVMTYHRDKWFTFLLVPPERSFAFFLACSVILKADM